MLFYFIKIGSIKISNDVYCMGKIITQQKYKQKEATYVKIFELISKIIDVLNRGIDIIEAIFKILTESGVDLKKLLDILCNKNKK